MSHRNNQLDVSGTLTTNLLLCYLDTTSITDDTFITDTLVLTAGTLIVLCRTEDALAEQTVTLRLIGTVVDGFRFGNLTEATLEDIFGRSKSDGNFSKITLYF